MSATRLLALLLAASAGGCSHDAGNGPGTSAPDGGVSGHGPGSVDGSAGSDSDGAVVATGCSGQSLLSLPVDPSARGPWPVGARTVTLSGLTTEIWYPARPGSDSGKPPVIYDIREHLPAADAAKIPAADNPPQPCDCVRDLPLDDAHGPYPVVVFVHGTAAFRTQSLTFMTHWASRGFVVVAADHPGIQLKDVLGSGGFPGQSDQAGDARKLVDALAQPTGELAFVAGHLDVARLAMAGHSAGGGAIAGFGDRAQVLIPMAAQGTMAGSALKSTLVLGAANDGIDMYSNVKSGYASSPKRKRLVGLGDNAGHLAFSDLCAIGADRGGILQIAKDHGVNVPFFIGSLAQDGCKKGQLAAVDGWHVVDFASSAVLEETLLCSPTAAAALAGMQAAVGHVQDYLEDL